MLARGALAGIGVWVIVLVLAVSCALQRVDPHSPGDRCLYSCPDGMICTGTTFPRGRANPGNCQLAQNRCVVTSDCRPRERCLRPGPAIGMCEAGALL